MRPAQVSATVGLLDDGATVPFIARYRKEVTGGLDDTVLRNLEGACLLLSHVEPSLSGPPCRCYRITDEGRQALRQWIAAWRATRDSVDSVLAVVPE